MTPHDPQTPTARLCDADARLLDLLIEHGPEALPADHARAQRLLAVWGLIGHWPGQTPNPTLARETMHAILAQQLDPQLLTPHVESLCPEDAAVVDALFAARQVGADALSTGPIPAGSADRAQAVRGLFALLDRAPAGSPHRPLAQLTIDHIAAYEESNAGLRLVGDNAAYASGSNRLVMGVGIRRLASVAALLAISLSVLLPVLNKSRSDAQALACQDNLRQAGQGLASYSMSHDDKLPQDAANTFSLLSRFADDANQQSTTDAALPASQINLFLLPKQGYASADALACPAVDPAAVGNYYNAQNAIAGGPIRLSEVTAPLLADNNPLYKLAGNGLVRRDGLPDDTASPNHNAAGQNVLARDGSAQWHIKPTVTQPYRQERPDNLWLNDGNPGQPDAFLTP